MNALSWLLVATVAALPLRVCAAASAPGLDALKKAVGFERLPGKTGKMLPGFVFRPEGYESLQLVVRTQDTSVGWPAPAAPTQRTWLGSPESIHLLVTVTVSSKGTADVQERLLYSLNCTSLPIHLHAKVGKQDVGDFCIVSENYVSAKEVFGWIHFGRNNVGVAISDRSARTRRARKEGAIDLLPLAREIDGRLKELPTYDMSEFRKSLPRITNLKADKPRVMVGGSVRLSYDIKPGKSLPDSRSRRGQSGRNSLLVRILDFDPAFTTRIRAADTKGAIIVPQKKGVLKLRVVCYDPSTLLSAEGTVTVNVVEDPQAQ